MKWWFESTNEKALGFEVSPNWHLFIHTFYLWPTWIGDSCLVWFYLCIYFLQRWLKVHLVRLKHRFDCFSDIINLQFKKQSDHIFLIIYEVSIFYLSSCIHIILISNMYQYQIFDNLYFLLLTYKLIFLYLKLNENLYYFF